MATTPLRIVGFETGDMLRVETVSGTPTVVSTSARTGTYSIECDGSGATTVTAKIRALAATGVPADFTKDNIALGIGFQIATGGTASRMCEFRNAAGGGLFGFRVTAGGTFQPTYFNVTNTLTALASGANVNDGLWHYVLLKATDVNSVGNTSIECYLDGTLVTSSTGLTIRSAAADVADLLVGTINGTAAAAKHRFDDIIIADGDYPTVDKIRNIFPTGVGSLTTGWTDSPDAGANNEYQAVDDIPNDGDTTYVVDGTSGNARTFAMTDMSALGIGLAEIGGVEVSGVFRDESVVSSVSLRARSSTTNSDTTAVDPGATYVSLGKILTTDPATAAAWTESGLNGLEVGAVNAASANVRATQFSAAIAYRDGHPRWHRHGGLPGMRYTQPRFGRSW